MSLLLRMRALVARNRKESGLIAAMILCVVAHITLIVWSLFGR
jgi:hypothetical protein